MAATDTLFGQQQPAARDDDRVAPIPPQPSPAPASVAAPSSSQPRTAAAPASTPSAPQSRESRAPGDEHPVDHVPPACKPHDPSLTLAQRILQVMRAVAYVQKGDKMVNGQYRFVSHDQVTGALRGHLVECGILTSVDVITHRQDGNRTEAEIEVTFINADRVDDRMTVHAFGYGIDQGDKGPGKAVSYAVKYALLKTFCLETGDDPDDVADAKHRQREPGAPLGRPTDQAPAPSGQRPDPPPPPARRPRRSPPAAAAGEDRATLMHRVKVAWDALPPEAQATLQASQLKSARDMDCSELRQLHKEIEQAADRNFF